MAPGAFQSPIHYQKPIGAAESRLAGERWCPSTSTAALCPHSDAKPSVKAWPWRHWDAKQVSPPP